MNNLKRGNILWVLFTSLRESERETAKLEKINKFLRLFVKYNLNINSPSNPDAPDYFIPLGYAVLLNIPKLFETLLELRANVNLPYTYHDRPVLIQLVMDISKKYDLRSKQDHDVETYVKNRITMLSDLIKFSGNLTGNLIVEVCDTSGNSAMNININGRQVMWEKVHKWILYDLKLPKYAAQFSKAMHRIDEKSHDYRCKE